MAGAYAITQLSRGVMESADGVSAVQPPLVLRHEIEI
jgi:hypothetical protein